MQNIDIKHKIKKAAKIAALNAPRVGLEPTTL